MDGGDEMNTENEPRKIIVLHETLFESIVSDVFTFSCILSAFYLNYKLIGQSFCLDALLFFVAITIIINKGNRSIKKMTRDELIEHLNDGWLR
jgi:hypothetical protein